MELSVSVPRFFVDRLPEAGAQASLPVLETAHARARRLSPGDEVLLFDRAGRGARARIARVSRSGVDLSVEQWLEEEGSGPGLTLLVAGVRLERLAWIAEKATELGAERLILVRAERSQAFRATENASRRLERVAVAAAKQSGTSRPVLIEGPLPVQEALRSQTATHRLFLDPGGAAFPPALEAGEAALAVGPEGGWTPREIELARGLGWVVTALPAGRLRTETAALAGLTLLRAALWGKASSTSV
jgi:16S rRNA (uracil1498-N3)-methyltransferase